MAKGKKRTKQPGSTARKRSHGVTSSFISSCKNFEEQIKSLNSKKYQELFYPIELQDKTEPKKDLEEIKGLQVSLLKILSEPSSPVMKELRDQWFFQAFSTSRKISSPELPKFISKLKSSIKQLQTRVSLIQQIDEEMGTRYQELKSAFETLRPEEREKTLRKLATFSVIDGSKVFELLKLHLLALNA